MAAELMLINPRRRRKHRRRKATSRGIIRARRNPRRRRKLSALQEQYFGKGRRKRSGGRRRRRSARVIQAQSNPRRRHRHRRRHYTVMRRNPSELSNNPVGFVSNMIVPAGVGALGGVAVNYIFTNYAPVNLQTGILNPLSRLALAAGLGMAVGAVTDNHTGAMVAAGAMTVTAYDMINNAMNGQGVFASTANSGGGMGRIMSLRGMRGMRGLGYMNPARQIGKQRRLGRFVR